MLLGFIITGGLTCPEIKRKNIRENKGEWQSEYAFHQLIFGDGKSNYELEQLPLLKRLRFFDPSKSSWRSADDRYSRGVDDLGDEDSDLAFPHGNTAEIRDAHRTMRGVYVEGTGSETGVEETVAIKKAATLLRRRDFFDLWQIDGDHSELNEERSKRLGLSDYSSFTRLLSNSAEVTEKRDILKRLVSGFHAIQGISPWFDFQTTKLVLLHSAFIRLNSPNSPVNSRVKISDMNLSAEPTEWSRTNSTKKVSEVCDWEPVNLYIQISDKELNLNLERYSYLIKASDGYFARSFYGSDVHRIQNYLADLSNNCDPEDKEILEIVTTKGCQEYELNKSENTIGSG